MFQLQISLVSFFEFFFYGADFILCINYYIVVPNKNRQNEAPFSIKGLDAIFF